MVASTSVKCEYTETPFSLGRCRKETASALSDIALGETAVKTARAREQLDAAIRIRDLRALIAHLAHTPRPVEGKNGRAASTRAPPSQPGLELSLPACTLLHLHSLPSFHTHSSQYFHCESTVH